MTIKLPFQTKTISLLVGVLGVINPINSNGQDTSVLIPSELTIQNTQTGIEADSGQKEFFAAESVNVRFCEKLGLKGLKNATIPEQFTMRTNKPTISAIVDHPEYQNQSQLVSEYYSRFSVHLQNPGNANDRLNLAKALFSVGKSDFAKDLLRYISLDDTANAELAYSFAAIRSMEGNAPDAARLLRKAMSLDHSITPDQMAGDPDFQNMRSTPEYVSFFVHDLDPEEKRIANWKSDLRCMVSQVEATHVNLFEKLDRTIWLENIERLNNEIPELSNFSIAMEFTRLIALAKDPNTFLFPPINGPYKFNQLPVMFYPFEDGIYIRSASPKYSEIVGGKLVEVAGVKTKEALERIKQFIPHQNEQTLKWMAPILLAVPEYLYGAGLADNMVQIPMKVVDTTNALVTVYFNAQRLYMDLLLTRTDHPTWPSARRKGELPLYQKNPNSPWWHEYVVEKNIVYMQYNFLMDKKDSDTRNYINQLVQAIEKNKADALIIDVRQNNMVNETPNNSLLIEAIKASSVGRSGKVFILQSHMTSAPAACLMSSPAECSQFVYAGERNASGAAFNRKDASIYLPNSQMMVSVSSKEFRSMFNYDVNKQTEPTIKATLTFEQYRNNQDPLLDAVYRYLGK